MAPTNRLGFVVTLGALTAVSATAIDICVPAQARIATSFGLDPSAGAALVGAYFLGFAPGQLVWGPLSDAFGRRIPLMVGMLGFIAAGIAAATLQSFEVILAARAVQGLMGGAAPVIGRAIARDQGGGAASASLLATMTMILGLAPLLAPVLGSGLLTLFDWPAIFWFLVLFGIATFISARIFVPETLVEKTPQALSPSGMARNALQLFRTRDFLVGTMIGGGIFTGYAGFLAMGAAIAEARYAVAPEAFGPLFAIASAGFVIGSVMSRQLARHGKIEFGLTLGTVLAASAGICLIVVADRQVGLPLFWLFIWVYVLAFGLLLPGALAKALEPAGKMAGLASSLAGAVTSLLGTLGATVTASGFAGSTYQSLCWTMGLAALFCLVVQMLSRIFAARDKGSDG